MKPVELSKIPTERAIFNGAWSIIRRYYYMQPKCVEWVKLVDEIDNIDGLGDNATDTASEVLAIDMALALFRYFEKLNEQRTKK